MNYSDVKYLAFEGGGGKAIAYLGAFRTLKAANILPYTIGGTIKGIAGTSGGAITAFFIALGLDADEINKMTLNDGFDQFYDPPVKGLYKSVVFDGKTNVSGFSVPKKDRGNFTTGLPIPLFFLEGSYRRERKVYGRILALLNKERFYKQNNFEQAKAAGKSYANNIGKFLSIPDLLREIIIRAFLSLGKKAAGSSSNPATEEIFGDEKNVNQTYNYLHSALHDRGIFLGQNMRAYFTRKLVELMESKYGVVLTIEQAQVYTFREFVEATQLEDFVIMGTNITYGTTKRFSKKDTPDFPVVDAVSFSTSIPGAFRPTFVNAVVDFKRLNSGKPEDLKYIREYMGLYLDGGTINNLPIHAFDKAADEKLNRNMLGIRSQNGTDEEFYFSDVNDNYKTDNLYKAYRDSLTKKRRREEAKAEKRSFNDIEYDHSGLLELRTDNSKPLSTVFAFAGEMYNSVTYYSEAGQIRTKEEENQTIALHAYDIGLFDFDMSQEEWQKNLSKFVQRTAAIKTAYSLGILPNKIQNGIDVDTFKKFIDYFNSFLLPQIKMENLAGNENVEDFENLTEWEKIQVRLYIDLIVSYGKL